jgi:hypothetical protein
VVVVWEAGNARSCEGTECMYIFYAGIVHMISVYAIWSV